jgi:hypothetical protein
VTIASNDTCYIRGDQAIDAVDPVDGWNVRLCGRHYVAVADKLPTRRDPDPDDLAWLARVLSAPWRRLHRWLFGEPL